MAYRDEHVGAGIVGGYAVAPFLDRAPPRLPTYRVGGTGGILGAFKRGRIERPDRHLGTPTRIMCENLEQAMWLIVEIMTAIRHHVIFVLAGLQRDPVRGFLEQIDCWRGIGGE